MKSVAIQKNAFENANPWLWHFKNVFPFLGMCIFKEAAFPWCNWRPFELRSLPDQSMTTGPKRAAPLTSQWKFGWRCAWAGEWVRWRFNSLVLIVWIRYSRIICIPVINSNTWYLTIVPRVAVYKKPPPSLPPPPPTLILQKMLNVTVLRAKHWKLDCHISKLALKILQNAHSGIGLCLFEGARGTTTRASSWELCL